MTCPSRLLAASGMLAPIAAVVFAAGGLAVPAATEEQAERAKGENDAVDFVRDIQPIFREHCYACHGPGKQESGLRLNLKKVAMAGGDNGVAIVPGRRGESPLYQRVAGIGDSERMPPEDEAAALSKEQIEIIGKWIDAGAPWPDSADAASGGESMHWAYRKPVRPKLPEVKNNTWPAGAVDTFILAKLEAEKLSPSPPLDRARLIRRVTLDLTGIAPTPGEVDAFLADEHPDAYERVVDRLLASPGYGERWAAAWLDLARYADTQGYEKDNRRTIWRYRDWVIAALNRDMPLDQFTVEQLAGDLLPSPTTDQLIATAFHRNTMTNTEGGTDDNEFHFEAVVDRVNTTLAVWMGTTINCCQCHSHKYDPFTQREFYGIFAYLNQTEDNDQPDERPTIATPTPHEERQQAELGREIAAIEAALANPAGRSAEETKRLTDQLAERKKQLAAVKPPTTPVMRELPGERRRKTFVHTRGAFTNPDKDQPVAPGVPSVLHPLPNGAPGNRLGLARWITSGENPLMPRVIMNRHWESLFGTGIVATSEDFGTQGERPSHPRLLDWLATELIRSDWSIKAMHRRLVTSSVYRQSAGAPRALFERDPYNRLLARGPRFRLPAETIRDQALSVAGLCSTRMYGPSVMPPQPEHVWQVVYSGDRWETPKDDNRYRRGLYTFWRRTSPYPSMTTFDAPSREYCLVRRSRTNTPLQALTTLNDPVYVEAAQALARRIVAEGGDDVRRRIDYGVRLCLARRATEKEIDRIATLYDQQLAHYRKETKAATLTASGPLGPLSPGMDPAEMAAWTVVAGVLLNLDETITRG